MDHLCDIEDYKTYIATPIYFPCPPTKQTNKQIVFLFIFHKGKLNKCMHSIVGAS